MVQVENEYGSFGKDKVYLNAVRQMIGKAGFDVTLFTSDGDPNKLAEETLTDVLAVINFGADNSPEKNSLPLINFANTCRGGAVSSESAGSTHGGSTFGWSQAGADQCRGLRELVFETPEAG
jgi:hypothetical protein